MLKSVRFKNLKALRDAELPLGPFTLIVGANGSGKSTVLQGLRELSPRPREGQEPSLEYARCVSVSEQGSEQPIEIIATWEKLAKGATTRKLVRKDDRPSYHRDADGRESSPSDCAVFDSWLAKIRIYSLDAARIKVPVHLSPAMELDYAGYQLLGVLDRLRDTHPERFDILNAELSRWLPEFDRILFQTPQQGIRSISLRTRQRGYQIPVSELSQGTLLVLAIFTIAYLPEPPTLVGLEEPDRGIHPRLLRDVREALYRLVYPADFGESREPVQVIATTHSPYFMDLFRDDLEQIVIAEKDGLDVKFVRMVDLPNVEEILRDCHLGDAWYSGILGGVPSQP